jgi:N-acyl homoserine lactone hydrolase
MKLILSLALLMTSAPWGIAQAQPAQAKSAQAKPKPPKSLRIYIFDCGLIKGLGVENFGFKPGEVPQRDSIVPCYLIAHPKGTLMWDVGLIPDGALNATGPTTQGISTVTRSLKSQMAEIGYQASDITFLAMSHYHSDHTANANDFAGSTWLVRQPDLDVMFSDKPPGIIKPATYSALKDSKRIVLKEDEYDVFGDKTVIIKSAPGHTPGHQVLLVRTKKTGAILIAGDLYHYPEEQTMNRYPTFEYNKQQTAQSRKEVAEFVKKNKAQMWIEHDIPTYEKLKKSPAFYE